MKRDISYLTRKTSGLVSSFLLIILLMLSAPLHTEAQVQQLSDSIDIVDTREQQQNINTIRNQTTAFNPSSGFVPPSEDEFFDTRFYYGGFDSHILASHEHDGDLYLGGWFNFVNGELLNTIAYWDGSSWITVGEGFNSGVSALTSFEGDLIAGGYFTKSGDTEIAYIARWDGSSWQPMGEGFNDGVEVLTVYDGELIAGGNFTANGSEDTDIYHLAKWDGSSWQPIGKGVNGPVYALKETDAGLVVAGDFTKHGISGSLDSEAFTGTYTITQNEKSVGVGSFDNGWLFNGSKEFEVELTNNEDSPFSAATRTFTATPLQGLDFDTKGEFTLEFDSENNTVRFPEQAIGLSCSDGILYGPAETISGSFNPDDDTEFTFGVTDDVTEDCGASDEVSFTATKTSSGTGSIASSTASNEVQNIALWDGTSWQSMGAGFNSSVRTLVEFDGMLYAGGSFTQSGEQVTASVAQWDGSSWQPVGNGIQGRPEGAFGPVVNDLTATSEGLVAAGSFTESNGTTLNSVARWDGSSWEDLGEELNGRPVFSGAGTTYDGNLFLGAGSPFYPPYEATAEMLENGEWTTLGEPDYGLGANIQAAGLYVDNETIYLSGRFDKVGDIEASHVAKYTPTNGWEAMGDGLDAFTRRMYVFNGTPIAAGNPFTFDDGSTSGIASWDGSSWSPMGGGINGSVWRFIEYDGSLVISGIFFEQNNNPGSGIVRWDGSSWQKMGNGLYAGAQAFGLAEFENDLIVGGYNLSESGEPLARWDGSQWHSFSSEGLDDVRVVRSINTHNNELYASYETNSGEYYVARWDQENNTWSTMGNGFASLIFDLESHAGDLYAMTFQSGIDTDLNGGLAKWNGSEWIPVGGQPLNGGGHSLFSTNDGIYFAGHFTGAGDTQMARLGLWVTDHESFIASPSSVTVNENESSIDLSWDEAASDEVVEFKIYSGPSVNDLSLLTSVDAGTQSHTINELPDGTEFYAVTAANIGGLESEYSEVVSYHSSTNELSENWKMISLPVQQAEITLDQSQIFSFNGTYQRESSLQSGQGYWVRSDESESFELNGEGLQSNTIELNEGWNMIGGLADSSKVASFSDPSEILTDAPVYRYNDGSYEEVSAVGTSEGYWIYASQEGSINMSISADPSASESEAQSKQLADSKKSGRNISPDKITFSVGDTDQDIWVTETHLSREQKYRYLMPPQAPEPRLDVRTRDGYKVIDGQRAEIQLEASSYPVTVKVAETENNSSGTYRIIAENGNQEEKFEISEDEAKILSKDYEKLTLKKVGAGSSDEMVYENKLNDNYPNPFNPSTNISYQISEQTDVTVKVYDSIGREVATLVNSQQQPGEYNVRFDASHLASGIYFVRLKAGNFTEIQKLTLIK